MKYIFSAIAIIIGFLLVRYTNWIINNFGYSDWAEAKFGSMGGTRMLWKIIGLIFIIGALLVISGLMNNLLAAIFSPLMRGP